MSSEIPRIQRVVSILWPSFITSALATILFFALFDPLVVFAGTALAEVGRLGAYTIGFFCFWGLTSLTSGLTCYFSQPCDDNRLRAERVTPDVAAVRKLGKAGDDDSLRNAM